MTSIYLDVCCLNHPFNDQTQDRIRLEAAAVLTVLEQVGHGQLLLIGSTVIQAEIDRNRDQNLKASLRQLAAAATDFVLVGEEQVQRASDLQGLGFHFLMRCTLPVPKRQGRTSCSRPMTACFGSRFVSARN